MANRYFISKNRTHLLVNVIRMNTGMFMMEHDSVNAFRHGVLFLFVYNVYLIGSIRRTLCGCLVDL